MPFPQEDPDPGGELVYSCRQVLYHRAIKAQRGVFSNSEVRSCLSPSHMPTGQFRFPEGMRVLGARFTVSPWGYGRKPYPESPSKAGDLQGSGRCTIPIPTTGLLWQEVTSSKFRHFA